MREKPEAGVPDSCSRFGVGVGLAVETVKVFFNRDQRLRLQSTERRRERADLQQIARPQEGVDALLGAFPRDIGPIPGVVDARAVAPSGQPVPAAASAPR